MPGTELETLLAELNDYSLQKTVNDLIEAGVDENFFRPMIDIFKNAIYSGATIENLTSELEGFITGSADKLGVLERYTGQVLSDTATQYTANYTQLVTEDLGLVFYKYSGNVQKDTRCFCKERVNKFFHKKEIEAWGNGDTTEGGLKSCGFPWPGMIAGTNGSSIFTYRGGWNCEHYIISVTIYSVPREVVIRNIENGNYVPNEKVKAYFNL